MSQCFSSAKSFDQDLDAWNVGSVTDMGRLFGSAISFDQTLASWDVTHREPNSLPTQACPSLTQPRGSGDSQLASRWQVRAEWAAKGLRRFGGAEFGDALAAVQVTLSFPSP